MQQISVFLENHSGQLAEITKALSQNSINLHALNIAETKDYGLIRLITDDPAKALEVLMGREFLVTKSEVVGVLVPDRVGGLNAVLELIAGAGIDVEYMYSALTAVMGQALMIFRVEDTAGLEAVLTKNGIEVVKRLG